MRVRMALLAASLALLATVGLPGTPALAVEPDEVLADPGLEARARTLSKQLRCLVCQNQSIDDSNADLARDLRILVRERLQAGDSNEQVMAYVTDRYGDYVLLKPPIKPSTYLLWFLPALILAFGAFAAYRYLQNRRGASRAPGGTLSKEEQARARAILDRSEQSPSG